MADKKTTLKDIRHGEMNYLQEPSSQPKFDPNRAHVVNVMKKNTANHYTADLLKGKRRWNAIVLKSTAQSHAYVSSEFQRTYTAFERGNEEGKFVNYTYKIFIAELDSFRKLPKDFSKEGAGEGAGLLNLCRDAIAPLGQSWGKVDYGTPVEVVFEDQERLRNAIIVDVHTNRRIALQGGTKPLWTTSAPRSRVGHPPVAYSPFTAGPCAAAPREYQHNLGKWRWTSTNQGDPAKPPDRFAEIPGRNNYRGGAINSYEQLRMLKDKYKIRTVVNLARDSMKYQPSSPIPCGGIRGNACEPKWAPDLGLKYIAAYLGHSPPSDAKWAEIREALADGGVYIHCSAGVDRTGATVARWRKEITPPGELSDSKLLSYTRHFGGYWRNHSDYQQTENKKLGDWALQGRYDAALAARACG